jgi:hypothetical protein
MLGCGAFMFGKKWIPFKSEVTFFLFEGNYHIVSIHFTEILNQWKWKAKYCRNGQTADIDSNTGRH